MTRDLVYRQALERLVDVGRDPQATCCAGAPDDHSVDCPSAIAAEALAWAPAFPREERS